MVCEGRQPTYRVQTLVAHLLSDTEHKLGMGMGRMSEWDGILDIACLEIPSSVGRKINLIFSSYTVWDSNVISSRRIK